MVQLNHGATSDGRWHDGNEWNLRGEDGKFGKLGVWGTLRDYTGEEPYKANGIAHGVVAEAFSELAELRSVYNSCLISKQETKSFTKLFPESKYWAQVKTIRRLQKHIQHVWDDLNDDPEFREYYMKTVIEDDLPMDEWIHPLDRDVD